MSTTWTLTARHQPDALVPRGRIWNDRDGVEIDRIGDRPSCILQPKKIAQVLSKKKSP